LGHRVLRRPGEAPPRQVCAWRKRRQSRSDQRAPQHKDDFDEWLARIICVAFSVPPQWAAKGNSTIFTESSIPTL
jgi:hypothetical protein